MIVPFVRCDGVPCLVGIALGLNMGRCALGGACPDDREGSQMTFVAEENIDTDAGVDAYPIDHPLVEPLLSECDSIGGYLCGPRLENALRAQLESGEVFMIK